MGTEYYIAKSERTAEIEQKFKDMKKVEGGSSLYQVATYKGTKPYPTLSLLVPLSFLRELRSDIKLEALGIDGSNISTLEDLIKYTTQSKIVVRQI